MSSHVQTCRRVSLSPVQVHKGGDLPRLLFDVLQRNSRHVHRRCASNTLQLNHKQKMSRHLLAIVPFFHPTHSAIRVVLYRILRRITVVLGYKGNNRQSSRGCMSVIGQLVTVIKGERRRASCSADTLDKTVMNRTALMILGRPGEN